MDIDPETTRELSDTEHIKLMTESRGWQLAYQTLTDKILDLQNINNIDATSAESAIGDIRARKMASEILFQWAKSDIYGRVEQAENAKRALTDTTPEPFIDRG